MKVPAAFREQVHKVGAKVLSGDTDRVLAVDLIERWAFKNSMALVHAVFRQFAKSALDGWLGRHSAELADEREHDPAEQLALDIFGDVPLRIEIGIGRFADLVACRRPQIQAAIRQADVKAENAAGHKQRIHDLGARLLPLLPDDEITVRDALRNLQASNGHRRPSPADIPTRRGQP